MKERENEKNRQKKKERGKKRKNDIVWEIKDREKERIN